MNTRASFQHIKIRGDICDWKRWKLALRRLLKRPDEWSNEYGSLYARVKEVLRFITAEERRRKHGQHNPTDQKADRPVHQKGRGKKRSARAER